MKHLTHSSVLPCTPDAFWRVFLDHAYVRSLYFDALGFRGFEILESGESSRKLRIVPKLNLPAVLERLIGDAFAYEEHGALDRARGEWTWRMMSPQKGPKLEVVTTSGSVRVEAVGSGQCRRTDELTIEGTVFGLRGLIESSAEKEARAAWAKEEPFMTQWLSRSRDEDAHRPADIGRVP
jgi:hypothetical protein